MLSHVNKIIFYLVIVLLFSCNREEREHLKLQKMRDLCYEKSVEVIGNYEYDFVYKCAGDTLRSWINSGLASNSYKRLNNWQIDSLICFDESRSKCIMAIHVQSTFKKNIISNDNINYFYGVKINGSWFFFNAASLILVRDNYQENLYVPIGIEKMKELAVKFIFSKYLIRISAEEYKINNDFFKDFTSVAWGTYQTTHEQWDSTYLEFIKRNWEKRDYSYKD